jgi:hypothetical protein
MDLAGLREALQKRPFEPFQIRLADGRALPVTHPETVAVGTRRIVVIGKDDGWTFVEPLLIVSLDQMPRSHNGKNRPRKTGS